MTVFPVVSASLCLAAQDTRMAKTDSKQINLPTRIYKGLLKNELIAVIYVPVYPGINSGHTGTKGYTR